MSKTRALTQCIVVFVLAMGLFSLLLEWEPVKLHFIEPFTVMVTRVASMLLTAFGPASSSSTLLTYRGFTVDIRNGCNGDVVHIIFAAAILGFPTSWRARGWGLLFGMPSVFLVNQARIVGLSLVGMHFPILFDTAHVFFGQVMVILATVILWVIWLEKFAAGRPA